MDIFKLFYDHDLRLDTPAKRNANKSKEEVEATLQDFMTPTLTFSKFYLTGTRVEEERFGLNILNTFEKIIQQLDTALSSSSYLTETGEYDSLAGAITSIDIGDVVSASDNGISRELITELQIDEESNVGHRHPELKSALKNETIVIYKEQAHHGFDLHLFSLANIYPALFNAFQPLVGDQFRFFSINNKRMRSERHFYFETWTLDRPPHGAEEVFPETTL